MFVAGEGGSSVVFEVLDKNRDVKAIKKVDLGEASPEEAQGYRNEINVLKKLQGSPRIIKLFDEEYLKAEKLLYVVMEKGETDLSTLLKKMEYKITDVQRKFYWAEMLKTVEVIHEAGVIHSDLKPANFLIVGGQVKLIDFGIASSVQSDKTSVFKDSQMGTFNYMAPEAIEDLSQDDPDDKDYKPSIKINRKNDIWSLGCILYKLTYGKLPFDHIKKPYMKMQAILNPEHKIEFPPHQDPDLVETIRRCLERDRDKRASVKELLEHPYLTKHSNNVGAIWKENNVQLDVASLISKLGLHLTPNSLSRAKSALQKH